MADADPTDWKTLVCSRLVSNARNYRRDVADIGRELERYDNGDFQEPYQEWMPEHSFFAKINKVQQYKREVGARLHNKNPVYAVSVTNALSFEREPEKWTMTRARSTVHQDYLNYCIGENHFYRNSREVLEESFMAWGVVWVGIDKDNPSVVTAEQDSWKNVYFDADAKKYRDGNYVIRRRFKPRWWLAQRYPDKRAQISGLHGTKRPSDRDENDLPADTTTEMVEFYEIYLKIGLHNYQEGRFAYDPAITLKDEPKKYVLVKDQLLLAEEEWETPYHLDGEFPCEILYYYPNTEGPYPISPLRSGIGWLRAMNWCMTMILAQYGFSSKQIIAYFDQLGIKLDDVDKEKILYSPDPIVPIKVELGSLADQNTSLRNVLEQYQFKTDLSSAEKIYDKLNEMFEQETGLYEFLNVGTPPKQDRSAAATNLRDRYAMSRIEDMSTCLDEFFSAVGRKMDLCAMYHMDPEEDIAPILGEEASEVWGILVDDETTEESVRLRYEEAGVSPEVAAEQAAAFALRSITLDEWMREAAFDIELGSLRRKSPDEKEQSMLALANQIGPQLADIGMPGVAAEIVAQIADSSGVDPQVVGKIREAGMLKQASIDEMDKLNLLKVQAEISAIQNQQQPAQPPMPTEVPQNAPV